MYTRGEFELEAPARAAAVHVDGAWERRAARGQQVVYLRPEDEHRARIHSQAAEGGALVPAVERRLEREVVHARLVAVVGLGLGLGIGLGLGLGLG